MKEIKSLIPDNLQNRQESSLYVSKPISPDNYQYSKQEVMRITYFFDKISRIYGEQHYKNHFRDEEGIKVAKREWGLRISKWDMQQLEAGFEYLKDQKEANESGYHFIDLGKIIGAIREANVPKAAHKEFQQERALVDQTAEERRIAKGIDVLNELFKEFGINRKSGDTWSENGEQVTRKEHGATPAEKKL